MQYILDYAVDNIDYIKVSSKGKPTGIDKKMKQTFKEKEWYTMHPSFR